MRSGDVGDEAERSAGDAGPIDLEAVRADDDLIEALAAGLVPPPCGPRDPSDIEGELVALLAGWVADVRPETLLHRPIDAVLAETRAEAASKNAEKKAGDPAEEDAPTAAIALATPSLLEHNELPRPIGPAAWRAAAAKRPYLLRAAAALVAVALVSSGVVARAYDAHPGEPLWLITKVAFPAKSHSVEAAMSVSTALNTARVALQQGRVDEARQAFETVAAQLADVDADDGRVELNHQMDYVNAQLAAAPAATNTQAAPRGHADRPLATGAAGAVIPSSPAVTPGATAALDTPSTSPSVLAAAPEGQIGGSPTWRGTSPAAAAVVAAPAPSGSTDSSPSEAVAASPPADAASNSAPPAASGPVGNQGSNPVSDPVVVAPTTTAQPAPATDPPSNPPASDPSPSNPPEPVVDSGTADPGGNQSAGDEHAATTESSGGGGSDNSANSNSDSGSSDNANNSSSDGSNSNSDNSSSNSSDSGSGDTQSTIDTNGAAGSTLGQVSAVTSTSDSSS